MFGQESAAPHEVFCLLIRSRSIDRWVPSLLARCCICGATGVCFHGAQLVERLVGATFGLEAKRLQTCRIQILQYSNKIQKRCSSHAEQMKAAQIACAGSANSRLITKSGHDH